MHCAESSIATVTLAALPSAAVVMSHHYRYDLPWVKRLLELEVPYVGLLGARKRAEKILADAATAGLAVNEAVRARLHAPVGLDLGGDGPELVALSVLAEIQSVLAGRNAQPLRDRRKGIHAPVD
jgi:xanthine/CO dehydrogenase XdhC/CoxF family maturation factor